MTLKDCTKAELLCVHIQSMSHSSSALVQSFNVIRNPPPPCILGRTSGAGPHTQLCPLPGKNRCSHPGRKRYGNVRSMCIFGSGADCAIAVPSFFLHFLVDFLSVFVDFPPRLWYLKSCEALRFIFSTSSPRPVRISGRGGPFSTARGRQRALFIVY